MKRLFVLVIALLLVVGCGSTRRLLVGNVSIYNQEGERVTYYQKAVIHDEGVREGVIYSNLSFRTTDDMEHTIQEGIVKVEGLEWVSEEPESVVIWYPYYESYPYRYYRSYRPTYRPTPPPPRREPRIEPRPQPRPQQPPQGGQPRPEPRRNDGGGRRR